MRSSRKGSGGNEAMLKAPCKNCTDRVLGCHDKCKRYIEFKTERKKELSALHSNDWVDATLMINRLNRNADKCGRRKIK